MLKIKCDFCLKELDEPGAIIVGPPLNDGNHEKMHVCVSCWKHGPRFDKPKPTTPDAGTGLSD